MCHTETGVGKRWCKKDPCHVFPPGFKFRFWCKLRICWGGGAGRGRGGGWALDFPLFILSQCSSFKMPVNPGKRPKYVCCFKCCFLYIYSILFLKIMTLHRKRYVLHQITHKGHSIRTGGPSKYLKYETVQINCKLALRFPSILDEKNALLYYNEIHTVCGKILNPAYCKPVPNTNPFKK